MPALVSLDPTFDNAAAIKWHWDNCEPLPKGFYCYQTPLYFGMASGGGLIGSGACQAYNMASYKPGNAAENSTCLCYNGPAKDADGKPISAMSFAGAHAEFARINFQRGLNGTLVDDGCTGMEIFRYGTPGQPYGVPSGKVTFRDTSWVGWSSANFYSDRGASTHADNCCYEGLTRWHTCHTCIRCNNGQANGFVITDGLLNASKVFCDFAHGGGVSANYIKFNGPGLLMFKLRATNSNTCSFVINDLKIDNTAVGWRLAEMDVSGSLILRVKGHVGKDAAEGPNALKLIEPSWKGAHWKEICLWRNSNYWRGGVNADGTLAWEDE